MNRLPCYMKDCYDYIKDDKYDWGWCRRMDTGSLMGIRKEEINLIDSTDVSLCKMVLPVCMFYNSLNGSKINDKES